MDGYRKLFWVLQLLVLPPQALSLCSLDHNDPSGELQAGSPGNDMTSASVTAREVYMLFHPGMPAK